jgi:hypothetical protein
MQKCGATTKKETACKAWAIQGSQPPRCSAHSGRRWGAPKQNQNAKTHGAYVTEPPTISLTEIIADLDRRRQQLAAYIDAHLAELDADAYTRLAALEGQLASRIGRLMRDKKQVQGDEMDELDKMIDEALDQLSQEWGIKL